MKVYDNHGNLLFMRLLATHAVSHQDGGADEVNVAGLSGELADRQKSKVGDSTLGWTANKFLKGAGTGSNPTEVDMPTGAPSGLIGMWHGLIANIPSGWVICDGNNSTPNLLARFVQGVASAATNPGATGGSNAKTTSGHYHNVYWYPSYGSGTANGVSGVQTATDSISDIRPPFYDVAFIMKT